MLAAAELSEAERWAVAARVAAINGAPAALQDRYRHRQRAAEDGAGSAARSPRRAAMLAFADRLGADAAAGNSRHLRDLEAAGMSAEAIAALARTILFVACQSQLAGQSGRTGARNP